MNDENISKLIKEKDNTYSNDNVYIILFYASWCGHCQSFKPTWEELKKLVKLNNLGNVVEFEEREIKDKNLSVNCYPTLGFFHKGKWKEHNQARSMYAIL